MKPTFLFRRFSLFTFASCVIAGTASAAPELLDEGFDLDSDHFTYMIPYSTTMNSQTRQGAQWVAQQGGLILYSTTTPSYQGGMDGGINLYGTPVNVILESMGSNWDGGTFEVWQVSQFYGTVPSPQPLFRVDGASGNSSFVGNVAISGSLDVGSSPVLTSASAASVLSSQNFVQLGSGGVLNIASTTLSTSSTTGAITVAGGIGVEKDSYINGIRIGRGTGTNIIVTSSNTAIGTNTLNSNYSGISNVALGYDALKSGVSASRNTALGYNSLKNHVSGDSNTAVGYNSLQNSTTAIYNTAVGSGALSATTTGSANSAVGMNALTANTTGTSNNAIGLSALQSNTTGSGNIAMGVGALGPNSTGGSNTAIGHIALGGNTSGSSNVAVGHQAGRYRIGDTTGLNNTSSVHLGANTRSLAVTDENSIVIGTNGEGAGSNTTVIGNGATTHTYLKGETNSASLRVTGATVLEGDVVLAEAQGDISMGDYQ